jgi:hypothetical protein
MNLTKALQFEGKQLMIKTHQYKENHMVKVKHNYTRRCIKKSMMRNCLAP